MNVCKNEPLRRQTRIAAVAAMCRLALMSSTWPATALIAAVLTGCGSTTDGGDGQSNGTTQGVVVSGAEAGKKLLGQMAAAYREASFYRDRGELTLVTRGAIPARTEKYKYAVEFARPNRIRIEAYSATAACDGQTIIGKISSPETQDYDGQIVVFDAPSRLSAEGVDAFDRALGGGISDAFSWPLPIGLLLAGERLEERFGSAGRVAVLPSKQIDGHECHCVQIEDDSGRSVWWIDKEEFLLRRFEFPLEELANRSVLGPNGEWLIDEGRQGPTGGMARRINPSDFSLVADFVDAEFAAPPEDRFTFAVADDAHRVKYLVPLPPPMPPDDLVGEPSPAFAFDTFTGDDYANKAVGKLTAESLRGKVASLLFWQNRDAPALEAFEKLAKSYEDRDDTAFFAVLTDADDAVTDTQLRESMARMKPSFEVARADHATAAFGLLAPSAAVFLSREGVVEDAILFDTLSAIADAPEIIDTLIADKSWHPRALGRYEEFRRQYAEQLALAKTGRVPPAEAAPHTPPQRHRLVSLWKQETLKQPGNMIVSPVAEAGLLILDGARSVVELGVGGQIGQRRDLKLPDGGDVGFLRVGTTRDARPFFVGSRLLQPKLYIFNEQWRVVAAYPDGPIPADEDNPEVSDIQVADIDVDGESDILVGYGGIHGVHMLSPEGRRRWSNRAVFGVSHLAIAPLGDEQPAIFVASFAAPTAVLDARGQERGRWQAQSGALSMLAAGAAADAADGASSSPRSFVGMALVGANQFVVLGLAADGAATWQYPLPPGIHGTQIQAVQWGRAVGDADHWIVAAADGSIHFLAADGKPLDRFSIGAIPTGITAATIGGKPALIVATKTGTVEAFRLEAAETIRPAE